MIKTYKIKSEANKKKIDKVKETLNLYRKDATKIAKLQYPAGLERSEEGNSSKEQISSTNNQK